MAYTRINWQDLPTTTTPRNATNLNKMDSAIKEHDDKLLGNTSMGDIVVNSITSTTGIDNYSTTETRIGTWIDGKSLYGKVITGTLVDGNLDVDLTSLNIYEIIRVDGFCGNQRPLNFYFSGYSVSTRFSGGHMYIFASSPYANDNFKMIIEYTKTTN